MRTYALFIVSTLLVVGCSNAFRFPEEGKATLQETFGLLKPGLRAMHTMVEGAKTRGERECQLALVDLLASGCFGFAPQRDFDLDFASMCTETCRAKWRTLIEECPSDQMGEGQPDLDVIMDIMCIQDDDGKYCMDTFSGYFLEGGSMDFDTWTGTDLGTFCVPCLYKIVTELMRLAPEQTNPGVAEGLFNFLCLRDGEDWCLLHFRDTPSCEREEDPGCIEQVWVHVCENRCASKMLYMMANFPSLTGEMSEGEGDHPFGVDLSDAAQARHIIRIICHHDPESEDTRPCIVRFFDDATEAFVSPCTWNILGTEGCAGSTTATACQAAVDSVLDSLGCCWGIVREFMDNNGGDDWTLIKGTCMDQEANSRALCPFVYNANVRKTITIPGMSWAKARKIKSSVERKICQDLSGALGISEEQCTATIHEASSRKRGSDGVEADVVLDVENETTREDIETDLATQIASEALTFPSASQAASREDGAGTLYFVSALLMTVIAITVLAVF